MKTKLIRTRRIIFTPDVELKEELAGTSIQITCYDRNGNEVKRVTSADDGTVEDNENVNDNTGGGDNVNDNVNDNGGGGDDNGGGGDDNGGGGDGLGDMG